MRFSQNVSRLQREGGFSQTQLAAFLGISRSTVSRILSNRDGTNQDYIPSYRTVRAVADKLGVGSDDVYKDRLVIEVT